MNLTGIYPKNSVQFFNGLFIEKTHQLIINMKPLLRTVVLMKWCYQDKRCCSRELLYWVALGER